MSTHKTFTTSYPAPFAGSDEQRYANRATHHHDYFDGDGRCMECDSRSGSVSAQYPCGADVPRVSITRTV